LTSAGNGPACRGASMRAAAVTDDLSELESLRRRIEEWRNSRPRSKAMPEGLWQEACAGARKLGAGRVARALGLNYAHLKERLRSPREARIGAPKRSGLPQVVTPQFLDLGRVADLGPPRGTEPMVVELVAPDGARLTIRTSDASASVLAMINAFRGRA
jgi:hypothetical protein